MLLCSSKIPVKEVCTKEAFVALAINWVTKSRNYGFPFFTWDGQSEILRKSSNGATFQVVLFEDGVICAVRLCSVDGRLAQWTADFILDTENKILAFQLYREALPDVAHIRREFSLPVLVQDVIAADFARKDENLDITDKPHLLHTEDASWVADIILRKQIYSLPIVYISCEYEGHCVVNPYMLAEKLNGVAHVLYETTRELSFSLKSLTDGKNPYAGAIEIFYPNGKRRILPRQLQGSHSKKVYSIVNTVIEHMAQLHIDSRYSLTQLQSNKLQILYISDVSRRPFIANYLQHTLQKEITVKAIYSSVDDFCEVVKIIKGLRFKQVDNMITRQNDIFKETISKTGLDVKEVQIKIGFGDTPVKDARSLLEWIHRERDAFERVIVVGVDDNDIEQTFDYSSILKHVELHLNKDENEHYDASEVKSELLKELRNSGNV